MASSTGRKPSIRTGQALEQPAEAQALLTGDGVAFFLPADARKPHRRRNELARQQLGKRVDEIPVLELEEVPLEALVELFLGQRPVSDRSKRRICPDACRACGRWRSK